MREIELFFPPKRPFHFVFDVNLGISTSNNIAINNFKYPLERKFISRRPSNKFHVWIDQRKLYRFTQKWKFLLAPYSISLNNKKPWKPWNAFARLCNTIFMLNIIIWNKNELFIVKLLLAVSRLRSYVCAARIYDGKLLWAISREFIVVVSVVHKNSLSICFLYYHHRGLVIWAFIVNFS
jgi:hypothetical protein